MAEPALVLLSGGMDSTTLLANALYAGRACQALVFKYPSKHNPYELRAAKAVASHYKVPYIEIFMDPIFRWFNSNLLTSGRKIPEGRYEDESMKQTMVPARNIIFSAVAAGLAQSMFNKQAEVWIGIHTGDHAIYPDCRPEFYENMARAIRFGTGGATVLKAPFCLIKKEGILKWGLAAKVPYHLTRTCYEAQELACGKCGSCRERLEAFEALGVADPIKYEGS